MLGAVRRACHAYYDAQTAARPQRAVWLAYLLDGNWHRHVLDTLRDAVAVPTVDMPA